MERLSLLKYGLQPYVVVFLVHLLKLPHFRTHGLIRTTETKKIKKFGTWCLIKSSFANIHPPPPIIFPFVSAVHFFSHEKEKKMTNALRLAASYITAAAGPTWRRLTNRLGAFGGVASGLHGVMTNSVNNTFITLNIRVTITAIHSRMP